MNQKGFINIAIIIGIMVLVGTASYFIVTKPTYLWLNSSPSSTSSTQNSVPSSNPTSAPTTTQPSSDNVLFVLDLTGNREAYVGKRVRVQGRIVVNVFYGERPCAENDPVCDTTTGARLELWQPKTVSGTENFLLPFVKNQPYPCQKTAHATYACPPYINNQITTIEGIWSKDQVPIQWVGSSGGSPPTPIKWEDRYFLNIE